MPGEDIRACKNSSSIEIWAILLGKNGDWDMLSGAYLKKTA
jgi:hypothetical protein